MTRSTAQSYVVVGGRPDAGRLRTLWRYRGLVLSFTLRELQVRYRQAVLGFAWAILQPAALTLVSTLIFVHVLRLDTGATPYHLVAFTALVPWAFFQTAVMGAVPVLVNNANLVRKIWFPREALPLATVFAVLTDLGAGLGVWIVLLLCHGVSLGAPLLWVPVLLLILLVFTAACALLGAAVNVRFRDVKHALPLLLQLLFLATPIVYPLATVPAAWQAMFELNPLVAVVEGLRDVGLDGAHPDPARTMIGAGVALVCLVAAYVIYTRVDQRFADVV